MKSILMATVLFFASVVQSADSDESRRDPSMALIEECFMHALSFLSLQDLLLHGELVSSSWREIILKDNLWIAPCQKRIRNYESRNDFAFSKVYFKYLALRPVLIACVMSQRLDDMSTMFEDQKAIQLTKGLVPEPTQMDELAKTVLQLLSDHPVVACVPYGPLSSSFFSAMSAALHQAKTTDVLVVFSCGNDGTEIIDDFLTQKFHEEFPNAMLATGYDGQAVFGNFGSCVDIAAPISHSRIKGTYVAALNLALIAGKIRARYPHLSASQIRTLLMKMATRTDETEVKLPHGGIVDEEAALRALDEEADFER